MMIGTNKKSSISEDDVSLLLQRYTATTILALLQEVAQFAGVKIDWNTLVKKTSTGISSAREYQMLWRHLAYCDRLEQKLDDDGAEPLDDDSDLEFELEPVPFLSNEASTEAAACVKVLLASALPNKSGSLNLSTVEAPLTINIPNGLASHTPHKSKLACFAQGTNITVPVSVLKQPLPTVPSVEGLDGNGGVSTSLPVKRKRKLWTAEEDMKLIAAVQKCGEGNWAKIVRGNFMHDRTASQLSQRWAIIRKRQANLNPSNAPSLYKYNLKPSKPSNSTSTTLSEAQLAACEAVSIALNMPMMGSLSSLCSTAGTHSSNTSNSLTFPATTNEPFQVCAPSSEASTRSALNSSSQVLSVPAKCSTIQEVAFAAGARTANPSTAASLLKAARSQNAVHIRQGETSLSKSSLPTSQLRGKGNYIRKPKPPKPTPLRAPVHSCWMPCVVQPGNQPPLPVAATSSNLPAQQGIQASKSATPLCALNIGGGENPTLVDELKDSLTMEAIENHQTTVNENQAVVNKTDENPTMVEKQKDLSNMEVRENLAMIENQIDLLDMEVGDNPILDEKQSDFSYMEVSESLNAVGNHTALPSLIVDENPILTEKHTDLQNMGMGENQTMSDTSCEANCC
ncbi:uncharacterized protein LOC143876271 [Tasmannia lanceolata]|uniref:uncharacterized protein LOC143876271 n=1 Tax=Tasmannia lanceolata TaxID=3420 RepID=UPI004062FA23